VIYFDHNATTPLDPTALDRMLPFLGERYGNPSSVHSAGQAARHAVDDAREAVATLIGAQPKEITFTSGGTEADNLAIRGAFRAALNGRRAIVTTAVEHPAVLDTVRALGREGVDVREVPVDSSGNLSWEHLDRAIVADTALVSVMWANNETGVIFPVERIGALCRERGVTFHVDAVQAAGKLPIDVARAPIDLLSLSAHKIGGPKGAGALWIRRGLSLSATQTGGHQERGRRGGTENVAAVAGFGAAAESARSRREEEQRRVTALRDALESRLLAAIPDMLIAGSGGERVGNTCCACFRDVEAEALLMALDLDGLCVSSGSACTAGSLEPSHVIRAMGIAAEYAHGAIRFSLGSGNTADEVTRAAELVRESVSRLRDRALKSAQSGRQDAR
jgi:cysteine desulfurase